MTEYSRIAKGNFTAQGLEGAVTGATIVLPFTPDFVEIWNYTTIKTAATHRVARAWWDVKLFDGANNPTMVEMYSGSTTSLVFDTISNASTNLAINPFQAGLGQQYGPSKAITTVTGSASPTMVTTTNPHGYQIGDTVIMYGIALGGTNNMQLLNGVPFTISAVGSTTTFSIVWDSSGGQYATVSPTAAFVKKVLYPFLYLPQDVVVTAVTTGSTTTVKTAMYHNLEVGQEIAFRVPNFWGITQLNSLPNLLIPGSPMYGYVTSITDNWTFVCNINSNAFTPFTNNTIMTSTTLIGLTYAQVIAAGDVNTGGLGIYGTGVNGFLTTSPLYPPPNFPTSTNRVPTINGPAIKGAFVNNTNQGFTIGTGITAVDGNAASSILKTDDIVYWHAYSHDYAAP